MSYCKDLLHRLRLSLGWVAAQFWAMLLLVLAGLAWTRLPDKHVWQVLLSLLVPLLLLAAFLVLQAGTMRRLLGPDDRRARFITGALTLIAWAALVWVAWAILDWCDDQIPLWAGYLNSRASAHARATLFTYEHIQSWLTLLVWVCRWIVLPAKVIPHAMASAQWGWRLPWRKLLRVLLNWRWWPAVIVAAPAGVALPGHFFTAEPHGTVTHQVWAVMLKLAGGYVLAIGCWALLLAWCAVLIARQAEPAEDALDHDLLHKLRLGRWWILGLALWMLLSELAETLAAHLPTHLQTSALVNVPVALVFLVAVLVLQVGFLRCMIGPDAKRVRVVWGTLMPLPWAALGLGAAFLLDLYHASPSLQALWWVLVLGALSPFAAASAQWGARLPWRRVVQVLANWRWWLGVLAAAVAGLAIPALLLPAPSGAADSSQGDIYLLRRILSDVFSLGSWVFLLGWFAVLLDRRGRGGQQPGDDALHAVPVGSAPLGSDSVRLPLPEGSDNGSRNA